MIESDEGHNQHITFRGDFSRKLVTNTFFNFVGRFWSFVATIVLTPFLLSKLTPSEFGTWVLFSVFLESFTLLDLGLGTAFVRFISAFYTHQNYDRINRVIFSGTVFYVLFGTLIILVGLAVRGMLFGFFDINDAGAETAYLFALVASAIGNLGVMFLSVFRGVQRMDRSNVVEMGMSIANVTGSILMLELGMGLTGLASNAMAVSFLGVAVAWWSVRRALPWVSFQFHFDAQLLGQMFRYGIQVLVSRIGALVSFRMDKLIVARMLGLPLVPFYEVGARLSAMVRAIPLLMISALIPATSELGARDDKDRIIRTYETASKYVALITLGFVTFVVTEAGPILRLWLGEGVEQSVLLAQILVIGYGANVLGGGASQTGAGVGRPEFDMRGSLLLTVLTPTLGLLLVRPLGSAGVAAGTSLALVASATYLVVSFHRSYLGTSVSKLFWSIHLRPLMAGTLSGFALAGLHRSLEASGSLTGVRYLIPLRLTADSLIFFSLYLVLLILFKQITAIDRRNVWGLVHFGFEVLRHPFRQWVKIYR